jgi:outer membrane lipoprotein-sorting protein
MNRPDENDDLLGHAARAMAEAPPEGEFPEQEILRHVQSVLASNGHAPRLAASTPQASPRRQPGPFFRRILNINPAVSVAASLLIAAGALAALTWALFQSRPVLAFSIVADQLHDARTMSADITVRESSLAMTGRLLFSAPSHFRLEFPGTPPEIADLQAGRIVIIDHPNKTAIVMHFDQKDVSPSDDPTARSLDWIEKLRNISHSAGKPVGQDEINGIHARQFVVTEDGQDITIWADAKTGAPLRVESSAKLGQRVIKLTLDHLVLDQPLDDGQFSTAVPAGYTQQQATVSAADATEKDLVAFLKNYAARTSSYPPGISDFERVLRPIVPDSASGALPGADFMQSMLRASRVIIFVSRLPDSADWHYAGATATPSAPDAATKPLFWYHAQAPEMWHVIYVDLHIADVAASAIANDVAAERQHKN